MIWKAQRSKIRAAVRGIERITAEADSERRADFERHILATHKRTQPWSLLRREGDSYLDLYVHFEWLGWKAATWKPKRRLSSK